MSDDENFMADRRGLKRAHESPKKVSSLFEGQALDVGDECSVDSDLEWTEHFKNHPSQQEPEDSEDEATESDDNDKCQSIETAIKNPDYWGMKDQDFKELAESFHAIYMDPDLRRELLQIEDGLDVEPDSAKDDESEMRSQIFDVFAQIQDLNKKRSPFYRIPELRPILIYFTMEDLFTTETSKKTSISKKKEELLQLCQVFDDTYGQTHPRMLLKTFTKEMLAIVGKRANRQSKGIFMNSGNDYLQGYEFKSKEPPENHGPVMAQAVSF